MTHVVLLLLLGPAQTTSGKYHKHSEEYARLYPVPKVALPAELPHEVDALCRLIEAGHETPQLFAALGEALLARGDKELAYRAFHKAHRLVEERKLTRPDPRMLAQRKDACPRVPDRVIAAEEYEARVWVDALQSYERSSIKAGKDPRDLEDFYERYGRPEQDLNAYIRARRISFLGGLGGIVIGVGFAAAAHSLPKRAAAAALLAGAACLVAPLLVGTAGLLYYGGVIALAGGLVVMRMGR